MNGKKLLLLLIAFVFTTIAYSQNCSVNANVDQTICSGNTLTLTGAVTGLFQAPQVTTWSQTSGPAAVITSPNSLITTVTGIIGGNTYKFRFSSNCQDGSLVYDEVTVTVNKVTTANAGPDQTAVCTGNPAGTLAGNAVGTGETGAWSIVSGGTGLTITTASSPTSTFKLVSGSSGVATLRWTITNSTTGCTSSDDVLITKLAPATPVTAGTDQTLTTCFNTTTSTTLAGSYAGDGTGGQGGKWTVVSGPNNPTITNTALNNSAISNLIPGTYVLRWTVTGPCVNGSATVNIIVGTPVGAVTAAAATISGNPTLPFCDGRTEVVLIGSTPKTGETGTWTQTAGPAGPTIVSPNSVTTSVTGLNGSSTYTFTYTIVYTATGCSNSKGINITYGTTQSLSITSAKPMLLNCGVTTASITYTSSGTGGANTYSIISGPTTPTYPTIPSSYVTAGSPLSLTGLTVAGTYVVRIKRTDGTGSMCSTVYDDITVVTSQTPTASNAGSGQILACTVTNTSLVGNTPSIGTGSWSQVSGPNMATIANPLLAICPISGLTNGSYSFRWTITGGPKCATNQADVSVKVSSITPTVANAGPDQSVCSTTPTYLAANTPSLNETGKWTVSPSSGVVFSDVNSPTATVTGLSPSTVYTFTWTISNSCGSSADNVVITTSAILGPIASNAGVDQCLASGTTTATLAGNNPTPGTGTWTKISGGAATITNPTAYNSTVTGMSNGTYKFEWSIERNACTITRDTMVITISANATVANAGTDQTICGTTATLAGNTALVGTGTWTQVTGAGGPVITNATSPTSTVTNLSAGVYTFRWTITNGACSSNYDDVILYVSTPPTTPSAGPNQSLCGITTATMAANTITAGNGYWSTIDGPNVPTITNTASPTTTVTGLTTGTYTFGWNSFNGAFCGVYTSTMTITVVPTATAGTDQTLCDVTSTNLTGNVSSTGTWTQVGTTPTIATITTTSPSTAVASDLVAGAGQYTFRYTISAPGCSSSADTHVTVSAFPTIANAGGDKEYCNVTSWTMTANTPTTGTGAWTRISGPNTPTLSSASSPTATVGVTGTHATAGSYVYEWRITNGTCTSADQVVIKIDNVATANAGSNQTHVCGTVATMAATAPTTGGGVWTQVSGPNTAAITSTVSATTTMTGLITGTYVFRWTVSDGICTPSSADVSITVFDNPTTPNAGVDQTICGSTSATLAGNPIMAGAGLWTQVSGPGCIITDATSPTSTITGLSVGTYVFQWTATLGTCVLSDQMNLVVYASPTVANAGSDFHSCLYAPLNLAGNTPTVGTGVWTQIAGNTAVISSPTSPTTAILGTDVGSYTFRWTITNGPCNPSTDDVVVTIDNTPTMPNAGTDQEVCNATTFTLAGNAITVGTGSWSQISGPNTATITNASLATSTVTNVTTGTYVFRWTATNGACTQYDETKIINDVPPTTANAGPDQTICSTSATMAADAVTVGSGLWTKISGPSGGAITTPGSPTTTITGIVAGTYVYRWTSTNGVCSNYDEVTIMKNCPPVAVNDLGTTNQGVTVTLTNSLLANDSDPDNTLLASKIDLDPSTPGIQTSITNSFGNWSVNTSTGKVTYVPNAGFNGTASLTYEICDTGTPVLCAQAEVIINVIPNGDVQTYDISPTPTFTTATINWSKGSMSSRVVFMKEGTGAITNPANNTTYAPSTNWQYKGDQLGSSGYYSIYDGSGTSVFVTGLYPGKTYTVQAFEYNGSAGSQSYLTNVIGAINPTTFVPWPTTTFYNTNGVYTQESWNTTARWDHDTIPTAALHTAVLVYIDGNCVVTNAAESNNLTIYAPHNGKTPKLTINPAHSLNVIGPFVNNGAASALLVKSSSTLPNGTLTWGTGTINGSVEMYSKAFWDLSQPVNSKYNWQFFGIPVKQITAGNTFNFNSCFVRGWDESVIDYYDVWVRQNDGTTLYQDASSILTAGQGYELVQQNPTTYTFSGELVHEDFTKILPYSDGAIFAGQQVLGNPYTAGVDISSITFGPNTEQAVYQYNTGTYQQWLNSQGQNVPGKGRGQHIAASKNAAGKNGVPGQIPSMQGFLVKATAATGSVTIPYVTSLKLDTSMQRVKRFVEAEVQTNVSTRIDMESDHFTDQMWIFTNPACTRKFDNGWDGRKIAGSTQTARLFAVEEDGNYQIDAVNNMNETVLAFQPAGDSRYKLTFNHENQETTYSSIFLMDLVDNKTIDITLSGSVYTFDAVANSPLNNRFKIVTESKSLNQEQAMKQVNVFGSKDYMFIQNKSPLTGDFILYNMAGRVVKSGTFSPNGITTISTQDLPSGVYSAKATTENEKTTEKIIIR